KIDGIEIDVRPGDAFMGTAPADSLVLPEGMTLAIPIPENGKIPIFRAVEKVEKLPDGTQKVYTRPATFEDVFKVLIIRNGEAILTGMKDKLGIKDLVTNPELYSRPETPQEKEGKLIAEYLYETQLKETFFDQAKQEGIPPDDPTLQKELKIMHMGFVEEFKSWWASLPPDKRQEYKNAITQDAQEKGVVLNFEKGEILIPEQSPGLKLSPKGYRRISVYSYSDDPWEKFYEKWSTMPLDFDVYSFANYSGQIIGGFVHKERTPIYKEIFRTFPIPFGDPKSPLTAHIGAIFFVKYALDVYFINIPALIKDLIREVTACPSLTDEHPNPDELSCCFGKWHLRGPIVKIYRYYNGERFYIHNLGRIFSCDEGNHNLFCDGSDRNCCNPDQRDCGGDKPESACTIGFGRTCFHYFKWVGGICDEIDDGPIGCQPVKIVFGRAYCLGSLCASPLPSLTIPRLPNLKKIVRLIGNSPYIVTELKTDNKLHFSQLGAMVGAIGYIQWNSGNECFSSYKLEDVIFETEVPISHVDESFEGGGAPLFTPLSPPFTPVPQKISLAPIINPECLFDFNISLRDLICNIGISVDGEVISLCDALSNKKVCSLDNLFIQILCSHIRFADIMHDLTMADLLKKIRLSDLFGSPGVSLSMRIGKAQLARVSLCDVFNRIFKENKVLEKDEDICDIVEIIGDTSNSLYDLLDFDVCSVAPVICGKKKLTDLVSGLNLRNIRFPGEVKLTMGEIFDRLSKVLNVKLPRLKVPTQSNEISNSSRTLTIMGIPIILSVKIDVSYRIVIEGMGNPKRGFWIIAGAQGGAGYIGAVPTREFTDLLTGQMRPARGAQLVGPGGEKFSQNPTLAVYTMEWDILLAQLSENNPTPLAGFAVISRCDEWTQFLKSRLIVGAGLKPDEAIGIKEAFFNEGYYQLLKEGIGNHPIVTLRVNEEEPLFSSEFQNKWHAVFKELYPSQLYRGYVIKFPRESNNKICVRVYEESVGGDFDPFPHEVSYYDDNNGFITISVKKVILKICDAPDNFLEGSDCSCDTNNNNNKSWFTKTLYCLGENCEPCPSGSKDEDCPGAIVGVEFCGGFRGGPVYKPGILRIQDSFLRLRVIPKASMAVDIFSFVLPIAGGPVITISAQVDAEAPIVAEVTLDSENVDINIPDGYPNVPAQFSGPLYEIPDLPRPLAECTLIGNSTLTSDLSIDTRIFVKIGSPLTAMFSARLPRINIPILRVDFFDYLPLSWVNALRRFGIYRVGDCKPGMRNFGDCKLARFYDCYEFCDHKDNDKDGIVDNNTGKTFSFLLSIANECPMISGLIKYLETEEYYIDNDGDGFGAEPLRYACTWMEDVPPNAVQVGGDCNDRDPQINPIAQEICDCKDNNCNGQIDEGYNGRTLYQDCDGDGFGYSNYATTVTNCCGLPQLPPGCRWVERGGDCDDNNCNINPIVIDNPGDGIDANCDGQDGMVRICFLRGD
ncbi:MAG: putative metal-binding motif-containing protein, partial [Candidatus Calescibacterium sp.]